MIKENKSRKYRRKFAYIYLLHRCFDGDYDEIMATMKFPDITREELLDWDSYFRNEVMQTIAEESNVNPDEDPKEVPTIKSIKEKTLIRIARQVERADDPSRLAQTYKILSDFEKADDKKNDSIVDAISESLQKGKSSGAGTPGEERVSLLEKINGGAPVVVKRGRGRPRKVKPEEAAGQQHKTEEE